MFKVKDYISLKLPPICIAHRGYSSTYPENTLLSLTKAVEAGAEVVELDVRATADQQLVVFHDPTLQRATGIEASINKLTLAQLKRIDLGKGQHIPTLSEALEALTGKIGLNIHLYVKGRQIDKVVELCTQHKALESAFLALSYPEEIARLRKDYPDVYICTGYRAAQHDYLEHALKLDAHILQALRGAPYLSKTWVEKAHENGFPVEVFYADTYMDMKWMQRLGVDSVLTNNPPTFHAVYGAPQNQRKPSPQTSRANKPPKWRL